MLKLGNLKTLYVPSGVTGRGKGGAEFPPETYHLDFFFGIIGKNEARTKDKKWKMMRKMKKNGKQKDEN